MVKENLQISQELDDKISTPMDWQKVLFLQIDRINKAMTNTEGNFMAGIDALEMDLAFFSEKDPVFKDDLAEIDKQAKIWLKKSMGSGGGVSTDKKMTLAYARARELMKALLRLMGRAGFYPENQATFKGKT